MSFMFCKTSSLPTLDLKSFDTSKVIDFSSMFNGSKAKPIYASSKWKVK